MTKRSLNLANGMKAEEIKKIFQLEDLTEYTIIKAAEDKDSVIVSIEIIPEDKIIILKGDESTT